MRFAEPAIKSADFSSEKIRNSLLNDLKDGTIITTCYLTLLSWSGFEKIVCRASIEEAYCYLLTNDERRRILKILKSYKREVVD
jgi:hypothetical protein